MKDDLKHGNEHTFRYAIYGALFGFAFPVFSTLIEASLLPGGVTMANLMEAQRTGKLLWVIDTAPIFLGFFAAIAGRRQDALEASMDALQKTYDQLSVTHDKLRGSAESLQLALEAKSQFLAKMSHELRTPLNVVIGFSRILLDRSADKLGKRELRHMNMINDSGQHLLSLVNDMLDLERIAAGRLKVHRGRVVVTDLARSVHEALNPQAEAEGYEFVLDVPDKPLAMDTDPDRLRQVLSNLVNNAVKYAGEGRITLKVASNDDGGIGFVVRDTGAGIPEDQAKMIFEPFHQIDNSTTRGKDGAGLGLSIVMRLVELLDGKVRVESKLGEGASFFVDFPKDVVRDADVEEKPPSEATETDTGKALVAFDSDSGEYEAPAGAPRILVIDDKKELLELIRHDLREAGYKVDVASSGEAGLAAAREKRPDAIVLDIIMPGMDGWEVLRRVRADPDISHTPIVVSSMLDNEPRAADFAVAAWLTKPFDSDELKRVLMQHADPEKCKDVLVVEDDEATRELLKTSMSDQVVDVRFAATGNEAIAALERSMPCAVVLDLGLPDISGFEVLRELRSRPGGEKVAVVVYTGREISDEEAAQLKEGLAQVIEKQTTRGVEGVVGILKRAIAGAGAAADRESSGTETSGTETSGTGTSGTGTSGTGADR
jgi:signal transduction histidine kinase/DNA-binding response OmpR family regulator